MNTKKRFSFRKAIKYISVSLVSLVVLWIAFHQIMVFFEKNKYQATGQLVEVDGNNMHVHVEGEGPKTILLLTGLGTSARVLDFEPLRRSGVHCRD